MDCFNKGGGGEGGERRRSPPHCKQNDPHNHPLLQKYCKHGDDMTFFTNVVEKRRGWGGARPRHSLQSAVASGAAVSGTDYSAV